MMMPGLIVLTRAPRSAQRTASAVTRSALPRLARVQDDSVAYLRAEAGRDPYDKDLQDLIGELSTRSDRFRQRWAAYDVRYHRTGAKRLHHPLVGDLTLDFEALELPGDEGQRLNVYTAPPHTPPPKHSPYSPAGPPPNRSRTSRDAPDHLAHPSIVDRPGRRLLASAARRLSWTRPQQNSAREPHFCSSEGDSMTGRVLAIDVVPGRRLTSTPRPAGSDACSGGDVAGSPDLGVPAAH